MMGENELDPLKCSTRKWDHLSETALHSALIVVENFYVPDIAQVVDECLYERMRDNKPLDSALVQRRLKQILDLRIGEKRDASQSLGLKPTRGKYLRPDTDLRDLRLAFLVSEKMHLNRHENNGRDLEVTPRKKLNLEDAIEAVASETDIGDRTVERAYHKYKEPVSWIPRDVLFAGVDTVPDQNSSQK